MRRTKNETANMQATIYLGPSSVSMLIAQQNHNGKYVELDHLSRPLDLASETFRKGKLSRGTTNQCAKIIGDYQQLISEYELAGPVETSLLGSNLLLDVQNIDTVVNRLHISTGLRLKVMDDGEMTRLLYLQMRLALKNHEEFNHKRILVIHMGPGNTRVFILKKGRINFYSRYRTGATRIAENLKLAEGRQGDADEKLIHNTVKTTIDQIEQDCKDAEGSDGAEGFDAILLLTQEFHNIHNFNPSGEFITRQDLSQLLENASQLSINGRIEHYQLDYAKVYSMLPAITFYKQIAERYKSDKVIINGHALNENVMRYLAPSAKQNEALEEETLHFASMLAARYHVDAEQGERIVHIAKKLFDQLQDLHGLSVHDRLLIKTAALLYKVGSYINPKQHHLHSQYIILNSELFGLSRLDLTIVGLLARYHRQGVPSLSKRVYAELEEKDRLRVQKLAAIMRVADALGSGHNKKIMNFSVRMQPRKIMLVVPKVQDLTIENLSLESKADLFTDIFGYEIALISGV